MEEVMTDLKETINTVEDYLKYLKDTYAQWIKINSVSFRPKYKKLKPIKRIIKPYNIVITHKELIHDECQIKNQINRHSLYVGQLCNGLRNGQGKLYVKEQLIYDGEWMNDMRYGRGKSYHNKKLLYEGNWRY
jgi:hypothetical protein